MCHPWSLLHETNDVFRTHNSRAQKKKTIAISSICTVFRIVFRLTNSQYTGGWQNAANTREPRLYLDSSDRRSGHNNIMTLSSYPDFRRAFVKRHQACRYYAIFPATQKSKNRTYHPIDTNTDDAPTAGAGAGAAGVLLPVVTVAAMHRVHGNGRRASRTVVRQPDGAVRARVAQRRPVVSGAQGEGECGQGPGALRGDG